MRSCKNFELRSDLLHKLELTPRSKLEAMPFADYQVMIQKRGAPPDLFTYRVQPSHVVIVRGTVAGVAGGDHVALTRL